MYRFRKDQLVLLSMTSFLVALFMSRFYGYLSASILVIVPIAVVVSLIGKGIFALVAAIIVGATIGLWRTYDWHQSWSLAESLRGQKVTMEGRVNTDAIYDDKLQTQFEMDSLSLIQSDGSLIQIKGKLRASGFGVPGVYRYDKVRITGKLGRGFGTRVGSISFAYVEVLGSSASPVESLRRWFASGIYSALSNTHASLALGILVGQRANIPQETQESLRIVGLTHIIAVSGYNLSVLVRLVRRGLSKASLFQSTLLSALLVSVFVALAGNSASVIRASWVIGLSLLAHVLGRNISPLSLLIVSAAFTAWFDPLYVWYDLGWWLSFGAFYGVLLIAPALTRRLYGSKQPSLIPQMVIETFAASLMTTPIIMWSFGRISLITLVANVLIGPATPLIMIASFATGLAYLSAAPQQLVGLVTMTARLTLGYVVKVAEYLSVVPYAELAKSIDTVQMLIIYASLVLFSIVLNLKHPQERAYNLLE